MCLTFYTVSENQKCFIQLCSQLIRVCSTGDVNKIKCRVLDVSSWWQKIEVLRETTVLVTLCSPQGKEEVKHVFHFTTFTKPASFLT
jgi:hypothetical protein